jgi:hypothetical protein
VQRSDTLTDRPPSPWADLSPDRAAALLDAALERQHALRLREDAAPLIAALPDAAQALGELTLLELARLAARLDALEAAQRAASLSREERVRLDPLRFIPRARQAAAAGTAEPPEDGPVAVDAGDPDFTGFGWWQAERTEGGSLRWSGAARCATLLLPALGGGDLALTICLRAPLRHPARPRGARPVPRRSAARAVHRLERRRHRHLRGARDAARDAGRRAAGAAAARCAVRGSRHRPAARHAARRPRAVLGAAGARVTPRIVLTGDLLRPQEEAFRPAQTGNILWLHRLLRRPVAAATGLEVQALAWAPPPGSGMAGFDTAGLYAAAGLPADAEGWAALFDATDLPREAAERLAAPFAGAAAVIGFELAEVQKRLLTRLGLAWVDLNIHPWRFGPDLAFAVQTNHAEVLAALTPHHAEAQDFEPWADLMAATATKIHVHPPVEEAVLVVGQTRVDRALIADGRLTDLRDHAAAFHAAIGPAGRVLFKPHPYNPDGFGLHELGLPLRRIRDSGENAYVLMAQDAIRRVVGVSSSLVEEARFFGKEGVFLGAPPFRIAATRAALAPGMHATVPDAWLAADFWRDVLAPVLPVTARDGRRPAFGPNALRNSLRQFWGWDEIAFGLPFDLAQRRAEERRARLPGV